MEFLYLAVVMGCTDDMASCDEVVSYELAASSREACIERTLGSDEAARADYPSVLADCRAVEEPLLLAEVDPAE